MNRTEKYFAVCILSLFFGGVLLAWSPWINEIRASSWAIKNFNASQRDGIVDGCGAVDAVTTKKELFGYRVLVFYHCGLVPSNSKPKSKEVFVTALGIVF